MVIKSASQISAKYTHLHAHTCIYIHTQETVTGHLPTHTPTHTTLLNVYKHSCLENIHSVPKTITYIVIYMENTAVIDILWQD